MLYSEANMNKVAFNKTMVAPVGKSNNIDVIIPPITLNKEMLTDIAIVFEKLVPSFNAITVGNIMKLEISIVPTTLIPKTIVIEVSIAIN